MSLSTQGFLRVLLSSILFLCPLFRLFFEGFLLLLLCVAPSFPPALVQAEQHCSIALFLLLPSARNRAGVAGLSSSSLPLSLCVCFCQRALREAALLSFLPFILFFFLPTWFLSVCALHLPPSLSLCLSEPVGSQTERVSRGLKRGIISLLLPPLAPSHSLSITVFIPPTPPPPHHTTQTVFHSSATHDFLLHLHFCHPLCSRVCAVIPTVQTETLEAVSRRGYARILRRHRGSV